MNSSTQEDHSYENGTHNDAGSGTDPDAGYRFGGIKFRLWSRSGFHYAFNSGLANDGVYESKVIVGVPTFARDPKYEGRWLQPVTAKFHFRLANGKLIEASKPIAG